MKDLFVYALKHWPATLTVVALSWLVVATGAARLSGLNRALEEEMANDDRVL